MANKIRFKEARRLRGDILVTAGETCEEIAARTGIEITPEDKAAFVQYGVAEYVDPSPQSPVPSPHNTDEEV